jgi:hypothetical protein
MCRMIKPIILMMIFGVFSLGFNAYGWSVIDWHVNSTGEPVNHEVIEGKIKSFDLDKMEIILEECELIGGNPLKLTKYTVCFKGEVTVDIVSARGGYKFQEKDELSLDHLKAGDYIKCNFKIVDDKFWAKRIVLVAPFVRVD